jgi:hypothetical protein
MISESSCRRYSRQRRPSAGIDDAHLQPALLQESDVHVLVAAGEETLSRSHTSGGSSMKKLQRQTETERT